MNRVEAQRGWEVRLFGGLTITSPEGEEFCISSRKAAELVAYLALARTSSVSRDTLAQVLWPEADLATARNRLKATLSILKAEVTGVPITTHGKQFIELDRSRAVIDAEICQRQLKWFQTVGRIEKATIARRLLERMQFPLLPEFDSEWVAISRSHFSGIAAGLERELETDSSHVQAIVLGDSLSGLHVPLVGRTEELQELLRWLDMPTSSRFTICGPPGVGKTRLLRECLKHAILKMDLIVVLSTSQSTDSPWLERLASTMKLREPELATQALVRFAQDYSRTLFVVDDMDQGQPAMIEWLEDVVQQIPHAILLAGMRRHAPEAGDHAITLEPMNQRSQPLGVELLKSFASYFGANEGTLASSEAALTELSAKVEGLPLALEVVAAWLPIMRPDELLRRVDGASQLLTRAEPVGRKSLADLMEQVLTQLEPPDRDALILLSTCRGGCGERLAQHLFGDQWVWRLRTLLGRSLAQRVDGRGENRFYVLQALREAVFEVADGESLDHANDRWRSACFAVAEEITYGVNERDRAQHLDWLRDEQGNILAALALETRTSQELGKALDVSDGLRAPFWLIGAINSFRVVYRGLVEKGLATFTDVTAETPSIILSHRQQALERSGRWQEAVKIRKLYRLAIEDSPNATKLADAWDREGDARAEAGDQVGAIECYERSQVHRESQGYLRHALWMESKIIKSEFELGRHTAARSRQSNCIAWAREVGDHNSLGVYLKQAAADASDIWDLETADELIQEAILEFRVAGESVTLFDALLVRAAVLIAAGSNVEAFGLLEEASHIEPPGDSERAARRASLTAMAGRIDNRRGIYNSLNAGFEMPSY